MDKAIYFMLRAIWHELRAQHPELGQTERDALYEFARESADTAAECYRRANPMRRTDEPPPAPSADIDPGVHVAEGGR